MSQTLAKKQAELISLFNDLDDWEARYKKIIELGKALPPMADQLKSDQNKVRGCQSQVWINAFLDEENRVQFQADSDALIVRGLVALVLQLYSGARPEEILATPPEFINTIGLSSHLSPSRANGLNAMIKQIKYYALAFQAQLSRKA